ncbi:MAG: hypothetical protein AAGA10_28030 [Bacteroidota bacterium]
MHTILGAGGSVKNELAKALALLGNSPESFNQTWHLPTASPALIGKEWIEAFAQALGVKPKYWEVGRRMTRFLELFSKEMREIPKMLYQNTQNYVFDSTKFTSHFEWKPTPYQEGIRQVVETG